MKGKSHALFVTLVVLGVGALPTDTAAQPGDITACGTISQPGSYKLANNLTATGGCLILVDGALTNTSIDLNGFTMLGDRTGAGITGSDIVEGLTIRNGTIKNFSHGIDVAGNTILVEKVQLIRNYVGLKADENVILRDSIMVGNELSGASLGTGSVIVGNVFSFNGSPGLPGAGLFSDVGSTIINNSAQRNVGIGLALTCPSTVMANTATANGRDIDILGAGCTITHGVP